MKFIKAMIAMSIFLSLTGRLQLNLSAAEMYISADVGSDDRGAVLRSTDGTNWTEVFDAGNFNGLNAIWAADSNHIWAVGRKGNIVSYNGQTWTQTTLDPGVVFEAISGTDANNVWAVGSNQTIYRFDGANWSREYTNYSLNTWITGISMLNDSSGWASGTDGLLYKYNGTNWIANGLSDATSIQDINVLSANQAWAFGGYGRILKYDGSTWQKQAVINDADYYGSYALDSNNVWVVGSKIWTDAPYGNEATIMKYNGSTWSLQRSNVSTNLYAVAAETPNNVWAVGYGGKITHYNGSVWVEKSPAYYDNMAGAFTGIVIVPEPSSLVYCLVSIAFLSGASFFGRQQQKTRCDPLNRIHSVRKS